MCLTSLREPDINHNSLTADATTRLLGDSDIQLELYVHSIDATRKRHKRNIFRRKKNSTTFSFRNSFFTLVSFQYILVHEEKAMEQVTERHIY
jgi:hypothetical protein